MDKQKDFWDKLTATSAIIASVLVPVAVALVGNAYTSALKESESRLKYTELAISILKENPAPEAQNVRGWAIDVLNMYSGVPIDSKAREELLKAPLEKVDQFIFFEWGPTFYENLINQPSVLSMIDRTFSKGSEKDQIELLVNLYEMSLLKLFKKRQELTSPIQEQQKSIPKMKTKDD